MKIWSSQWYLQCKQLQIYPKNFQDFWTLGLCVSAAVLYQLSYEDLFIASRPICWLYFRSLHHLHPTFHSIHGLRRTQQIVVMELMPRIKNGGRQEFNFEWKELDIQYWAQKHFTYFESNFSAPSACVHVSPPPPLFFFQRRFIKSLTWCNKLVARFISVPREKESQGPWSISLSVACRGG